MTAEALHPQTKFLSPEEKSKLVDMILKDMEPIKVIPLKKLTPKQLRSIERKKRIRKTHLKYGPYN